MCRPRSRPEMNDPQRDLIVYSLVVPVYNEEAVIPLLLHRLDALLHRLDGAAEVILVNDGSKDTGPIVLAAKCRNDPRYRLIRLSRNFGHQIAISAGLDAAQGTGGHRHGRRSSGSARGRGDDDRALARGLRDRLCQALPARRRDAFKQLTAKLFYGLLARFSSVAIPTEVGDFRLVDRTVLEAFRAMPERDRFVRGMFAWLGFRQTYVEFERPPRAAGETKYPIWKMARLAVSGFIGFPTRRCCSPSGSAPSSPASAWRTGFLSSAPGPRARLSSPAGHRLSSRHRALRHEHVADRHRRSLRRSYPCRGEAPAALHRRRGARVRCNGGAAERAPGSPAFPGQERGANLLAARRSA